MKIGMVSIGDYRKYSVEDRLVDLMKSIGMGEEAYRVSECRKKYYRLYCEKGANEPVETCKGYHAYAKRCHLPYSCPHCSRVDVQEKIGRFIGLTTEAFSGIGKPEFMKLVLTIPMEVQVKVTQESENRFIRAGCKVIKEIFPEFEIGGSVVMHYWHSDKVNKGWFPHLHFVVPAIGWDDKNKKRVRLGFDGADGYGLFMSKERLARLREAWRVKMCRFAQKKIRAVDIDYRYQYGMTGITHRLAYDMRHPVKDVAEWVSTHTYDSKEGEWLRRLLQPLQKNRKHVRYFGWMAPRETKGFLKKIGKRYVPMKEWRKNRRENIAKCPVHGCDLKLIEGLVSFEDLGSEYVLRQSRKMTTVKWLNG